MSKLLGGKIVLQKRLKMGFQMRALTLLIHPNIFMMSEFYFLFFRSDDCTLIYLLGLIFPSLNLLTL